MLFELTSPNKMTMADSDESWFIEKATSCARYDSFAAKAWLLCGKTLFPQSLLLQVQLLYNVLV